ncbi:MAG: sensor histidine kinase [Micromonosporaceae bacterium]
MLLVGATSSLILVAFIVPLALLVRAAAADRAMSAAVVEAQAFAPAVTSVDAVDLDLAVAHLNASARHPLTVFLPDGRVIGVPVPASSAVDIGWTGRSTTAPAPGGREVVVAVAGLSEGTAVIRTFVSDAELRAGVNRSWTVLALLGLGLLGVSLLVADRLARALTRPLSAVADVSHRLAQGSLSARAGADGPPEVREVSTGLNLLADRISELLAQEREAVADLSHRLRTPLTALRIDVESLPEAPARTRLMADLDAVDRTVDAVIREADRPVREGVAVGCDAAAVVVERVQFWSVLAEEENRRVSLSVPADRVPVRLTRDDLAACVDALIGNVFRHTPEGTAFAVTLAVWPSGGGRLTVADSGPGLPDGPIHRRGESGAGSTGLGLDIVRRTAANSGGGMGFGRSAAGGAAVTVELGPPAPAVVRSHRERRGAPRGR